MAATKIEKATMAHMLDELRRIGGWTISERTPGKHTIALKGSTGIDIFLMGDKLFAEKFTVTDVTDSSDQVIAWAEGV